MRMLIEFSRSADVSRSTASDISTMSASSRRPATSLSRACTVTSSPTRLTSWSSLSADTRMLDALPGPLARRESGAAPSGRRGLPCAGVLLPVRDALDGEFAIVFDEDEDIADRLGRSGRGQDHIPGQITAFRVDLAERRNRGGIEFDPEPAQFPQFAQQEQRVGPIQHHVRPRPEADAPLMREAARGAVAAAPAKGLCPAEGRRSLSAGAVWRESPRSGPGPRCRGPRRRPAWF